MNDWKGIEMYTLSEFCFMIDQTKTPLLNDMDLNHILDVEFTDINDNNINYDVDVYDQLMFYKQDIKNARKCIHNNS